MREKIERMLLMGLGVLALTREKAQALVDDLVKRGEVRKEEVQRLVDRLAAYGEEERKALRNLIREEIKKVLDEADLPSKQDIAALGKKIDKLSKG